MLYEVITPNVTILAAIDAGNLQDVALGACRRWPTTELVIAADDDRLTKGNPGITKANAAAAAAPAPSPTPLPTRAVV